MALSGAVTLSNGTEIQQVTIAGGGLEAKIVTAGAAVQDLRLEGHQPPLILGFQNLEDYANNRACMGAIAGRYANRIGGASINIDGQRFALEANWLGRHALHGGTDGLQYQNWQLKGMTDDSVTLSVTLPDGHMGYPGNLTVLCVYTLLDEGKLDIALSATTDKPTVCGLASHCYFNLDGRAQIDKHKIQILTQRVLEYNEDHIPTGTILDVTGTRFDLRSPKAISDSLLDANFCLSDAPEPLREVANVSASAGCPKMTVLTNQPGLQIFNAPEFCLESSGLEGRSYGPYAGLAIEPQNWPDAPNRENFPDAILRPGETYNNHSQFKFT